MSDALSPDGDQPELRPNPADALSAWSIETPILVSSADLSGKAYVCLGTPAMTTGADGRVGARSLSVVRLDDSPFPNHRSRSHVHHHRVRIIEGELVVADRFLEGVYIRNANAEMFRPFHGLERSPLDAGEAGYVVDLAVAGLRAAQADICCVRTTDAEIVLAGIRRGMSAAVIVNRPTWYRDENTNHDPFRVDEDTAWERTSWGSQAAFESWSLQASLQIESVIKRSRAADIQSEIDDANSFFPTLPGIKSHQVWVELVIP